MEQLVHLFLHRLLSVRKVMVNAHQMKHAVNQYVQRHFRAGVAEFIRVVSDPIRANNHVSEQIHVRS